MQLSETQKFLRQLRKSGLTPQQKRTLKGQVLAGDFESAKKGYEKLMNRKNDRKGEAV